MGHVADEGGIPVEVTESELQNLRSRVRATRLVDAPGEGWSRGVDRDFLQELLRHWAESYDWRVAERGIRQLPWTRAGGLRVIHQRAVEEGAPAVVLLHGWPDSVLRFQRVLPFLTDMNVVVPALPGFPLSESAGMAGAAMVGPVAAAMSELGYVRYTASGGDVGAPVAEGLARHDQTHVASLHLTDIGLGHAHLVPSHERTPAIESFLMAAQQWGAAEGGYAAEQTTKPSTLAVGLGDSPAGLAAWLVEKYRSWIDGELADAFSFDDLLTWVSLYWFTSSIGTSFSPYSERQPPEAPRVEVPTAISVFPGEPVALPRELAERVFDVRVWSEHRAGGHFAAWEQPEAFAADVRAAVALGRSPS